MNTAKLEFDYLLVLTLVVPKAFVQYSGDAAFGLLYKNCSRTASSVSLSVAAVHLASLGIGKQNEVCLDSYCLRHRID